MKNNFAVTRTILSPAKTCPEEWYARSSELGAWILTVRFTVKRFLGNTFSVKNDGS
jgi:hypothetical protein